MGRGSHERYYNFTKEHIHKVFDSQGNKHNFVIDRSITLDEYVYIDISSTNKELSSIDHSNSGDLNTYINNYLAKNKAKVAYGGYLEVRDIYKRHSEFACSDTRMERNIHLGMDFWCAAKTPVLAVLRGKVHSFQNNKDLGDYGPTIILEHYIQGERFYSLYGHLSLDSLDDLYVGKEVEDGEVIGYVGEMDVNGDYSPHLHFQLIEDIQDLYGDYPGVSCQENIGFYKENCPDPNMLLNLKLS